MAMNYVGSISILDRGDAPAQAVLDRNARTLAKRVADETKEDLAKVMQRVDNIYGNFELSNTLLDSNRAANIEYANDLAELEDIINNQVTKKKYHQQVTIFIVGYENVCGQKLRLLQQVNEFFMENSSKFEEEDVMIKSPELELDDMAEVVEETLKTSENLARRLGELNKEMVEYMYNYAQAKASNKGKKKLERALGQAREDVNSMQEKLQALQQEMEEREEKMQQLYKQIEMKNMEAQRYKTAAEVAKRSAGESDKLRDEINKRDERIKELRQNIDKLEIELSQILDKNEHVTARLPQNKDESMENLQGVQRVLQVSTIEENTTGDKRILTDEIKDLHEMYKIQNEEAKHAHMQEVEEMKLQHADEIKRLLQSAAHQAQAYQQVTFLVPKQGQTVTQPDTSDSVSLKSVEQGVVILPKDILSEPGSHSRPVTKEKGKDRLKTIKNVRGNQELGIDNENHGSRRNEVNVNEDGSTNSRIGNEGQLPTQSYSEVMDFDDKFDIMDEESWMSIPKEHSIGRFNQYRQLTYQKINDLESKIEETVLKTQRKIETLKAQFQEHKKKWETEREIILHHVDQAASLQEQAEQEADAAISQLDEFITEQEILEKEEDKIRIKRIQEIDKIGLSTLHDTEEALQIAKDQLWQQEKKKEELYVDLHQQQEAKKEIEDQLLSQTDDAKVQLSKNSAASSVVNNDSSKLNVATTDEIFETCGNTPEELARTSALSRHSLRELHKQALSSLKASAESRQGRSPSTYSIRDQKSVLSTAELDENGDMPFPPDESRCDRMLKEGQSTMQDIGTSPIAFLTREKTNDSILTNSFSLLSRSPTVPGIKVEEISNHDEGPDDLDKWHSIPIYDHPIAQEFFRSYDAVISFKNNLGNVFLEKDIMSAGQILTDIEPHQVDYASKIQPQVEQMTGQMFDILEECLNLIINTMHRDQEPVVSSLTYMSDEGFTTKTWCKEQSEISYKAQESLSLHPSSNRRDSAVEDHIDSLKKKCAVLESSLREERDNHKEQLNHNTVMLMELQDTIDALQRELAISNKSPIFGVGNLSHPPDSPVMFTRLDSERNAKIMKKAMNEKRLDDGMYGSAVKAMEEYRDVPARRFVSLVHKYIHHCQMKEIEENVRKSRSLNRNVLSILGRMESLQTNRAKRWAHKMDEIASQRFHLAELLMATFENIERESGIFLIKPFYSYQSQSVAERIHKKNRPHHQPKSSNNGQPSSLAPAPTPASNLKSFDLSDDQHKINEGASSYNGKISGKASQLIGDYPRPVWMPTVAQTRPLQQEGKELIQSSLLNTPRMLELDINRMLISQNQISVKIPANFTSNDHLANASNRTVRGYMTVNRPLGKPGEDADLSSFHNDKPDSSAPPTTPQEMPRFCAKMINNSHSENSDDELLDASKPVLPSKTSTSTCRNLPATTPLPPISGSLESGFPSPPMSPPGSSARQSPSSK